ncbi:MAG: hypothetical protein L3J41_08105 [Melioribacteraceae bacterium]|nr:hypothetical protein [Melioribacteraceae bacterium]
MKKYIKIFIILIMALLNISGCDSATESTKNITYKVISIMGKPIVEYKDYANKYEYLDFPIMFFFESRTPPFKGKVLLYKLGIKEFRNFPLSEENYFRVDVEGELGIVVEIKFFWLDFNGGVMKGTFALTGETINGFGYEFEAVRK